MEFKDSIKYYRTKQGFTRKALANQLDISVSLLNAYENGYRKPSYEVLSDLSDTLKVSVDELMGRCPIQSEPIDGDILEMVQNIISNPELVAIIKQIPSSEKCKKCVIIQFLCETITKLISKKQ